MRSHWKKVLLLGILAVTLLAAACSADPPKSLAESDLPRNAASTPSEPQEGIDLFFPCSGHDLLSTYKGKSETDFENACKTYEDLGYTLYSSMEPGGNLAKTYTKNETLAHLYYHPSIRELNVVVSDNLGANLPPATPKETSGDFECTVTQLNQVKYGSGGMGYVIQLKDGSFIVYDGGLAASADEILAILRESCPEGKPLIRAWILTHFHNDHYEAFYETARRMQEEELLTLEYVIASPIVEGYQNFLAGFSARFFAFGDAKFIFAHTGMKFTFCNLTLEILYTPESLYKTGTPVENFNNTSMLTRLQDGDFSMLFTGDLALEGASLCESLYGDSLASDWCQMSHHGLEDCPLSFYERVKASVYWVPTTPAVYRGERNLALRRAVEALPTTKEILVAGETLYTRPFPGS